MKEYTYVNDIGEPKKIVIGEKNTDDTFPIFLWSLRTGDYCGGGKMTKEELEHYFNHYGIRGALV